MAANTTPIFSKVGVISWATLTAANTALDGTGTVGTLFTADATNGGRVERIRIMPLGTNIATVLRIFVNNGSTNTTAANNSLLAEVALAATTLTQIAAQTPNDIPNSLDVVLPIVLPPGYKLLATLGTAVAAGYSIVALGGSY